MTVIWGGLAALLVGIGLGLQQTFNDLLSGILLLFERSVEVEDVVQIDGLIGSVKTDRPSGFHSRNQRKRVGNCPEFQTRNQQCD